MLRELLQWMAEKQNQATDFFNRIVWELENESYLDWSVYVWIALATTVVPIALCFGNFCWDILKGLLEKYDTASRTILDGNGVTWRRDPEADSRSFDDERPDAWRNQKTGEWYYARRRQNPDFEITNGSPVPDEPAGALGVNSYTASKPRRPPPLPWQVP